MEIQIHEKCYKIHVKLIRTILWDKTGVREIIFFLVEVKK